MAAEKLVLDLETQKAFDDVGGRGNAALLKVSLVGVYRYATEEYVTFEEAQLPQLEALLRSATLVIGFNIRKFDLEVLAPYLSCSITELPVLDLMEEVARHLGFRVSLESLAEATLGQKKLGHGLDAIRYYQAGDWDALKKYCLHDVKLTKELYEYGLQHGRLKCNSKYGGQQLIIPVCWPERRQDVKLIANILQEAFQRKLSVEIEYLSTTAQPGPASGEAGEPLQKRRQVDIYHLEGAALEGYCHLRQALRQFRLDRIIEAKITWRRYAIPADYQPSLPVPSL
ncbi:MAG: WYL domain-containing protein [Candidatus Omnitrophica bacterium]|nr:WYL domain-containing protein [Candidatus Omnitrophota bacterium]